MRVRIARLAVMLCLALPVIASASPKTDLVVLRNGDHLTCEVVRLRQGKLEVKTDDMGTVSIEWDKLVGLQSTSQFDITTRDGIRRVGRIEQGPPDAMRVMASDGSATPLSLADVVSMAPVKSGFFSRIDGSIDLGASYTESSGVGQLSLDAQAKYRRPAFADAAQFSTNLTREPDTADTSRYSMKLTHTRYLRDRWVLGGLGVFEGNADLGFTFRGTGGVSVGRYLAQSNRVEWLLQGGLAGGREMPVDGETVTNVDALIASALSVFAYDYPNTRIDFAVLVFPSLDDPGRVRLDGNAKLKRELFHDVYIAATLYDTFDNRSKAGDTSKNDFGGSLSFGWSF